MYVEHQGYSAVLVLLAISGLALTLPNGSRYVSALITLSLVAAFLFVLFTLRHDR
jgi:hypothetical protein